MSKLVVVLKRVARVLLLFIIAIGIVWLILSYCADWRYVGQKNLVFTVASENTGKTIEDHIYSQNWKDDTTLIVKVADYYACGGNDIWGSYKVEGDRLTLFSGVKKLGFKLVRVAEACKFRYSMTYEISDLEHKDYLVTYIKLP